MFNAIKECMKNWLITHERLYWYIVVGLAVFGFGLITAIGCAKLYDANAAEYVDYHADHDYKTIYETACNWVENSNLYGAEYLEAHPYRIVVAGWGETNYGANVYFFAEPISLSLGNWGMQENTIPETLSVYILFEGCKYESYATRTSLRADIQSLRYTTYDIYNGDDVVVEKTKDLVFSSNAPYIDFVGLTVDNKFLNEKYNVLYEDIYQDFYVPSLWTYEGELKNMSPDDLEYKCNIHFYIDLPTDTYVETLFDKNGYSLKYLGASIVKHTKEVIKQWYKDDNASFCTYEIIYPVQLVPDNNGRFSLTFKFPELEYLIRASSPDVNLQFEEYIAAKRAHLMSFVHVSKLVFEVEAVRSDSIVYGHYTANQFERGVYDSCLEVLAFVDKDITSEDALENLINTELDYQYTLYVNSLQDEIDELKQQMQDVGTVGSIFSGGLESSDLWTGFQSLAEGLASLAPAIASLSLLAGSVFAFLPSPIMTMVMFTFFAICIIAIVKAVRG